MKLGFSTAPWAQSPNHIVYRSHHIAIWNIHYRYWRIDTESALAVLAIKMNMHIIMLIMIMTPAQFIPHAVSTCLNSMNKMLFPEEVQGTRYNRLVDGNNLCLQFTHRQWAVCLLKRTQYNYPVCRWFDGMSNKQRL